ncbi:MAG: NTP transferase domain-containing protein [Opitutae bacterium]|jgi:NDP-sugar pyrophosphorylase family protein|nr:NTP transferase domain-containing protein [Opitutae bacterium]MBT5378892.1 NTP transferase domain-containing protein [Opitutae bacterium]MBT5690756.1 NTP transferase domain-containing protein [Opitutae bacterium]MBT6463611.1 NTP transferase domain-containing protein [Opitutae bacterium]MBT6957052.1 NTP transferase domain-containing protein [Opitutae bacterium]
MNISLVVLAAGMGNRFGGLKQLTGIGPNGETLLEYGVYDAWRAGVKKVIFVIRRSFELEFRKLVISRFPSKLKVVCVYQDLEDLPCERISPKGRTKPWGTGHAVLAARHELSGPFIVINGDDFYGASAFQDLVGFLKNDTSGFNGMRFALGGYRLRNTLSGHGSVSRGICEVDEQGFLKSLKEHQELSWNISETFVHSRKHGIQFTGEELVSLNLFALQSELLQALNDNFEDFLSANEGDLNAEFFLPEVISRLILDGDATLRVLPTEESWFGMTYAEERTAVEAAILERIDEGVYPNKLWEYT